MKLPLFISTAAAAASAVDRDVNALTYTGVATNAGASDAMKNVANAGFGTHAYGAS